jgi:hypothetical protein
MSMGPLVTDIATILNGDGLGTLGTDIFASKEPDQPDNCITIYNTGGLPDDCLDLTSKDEICTFQVRVRNNSYLSAYAVMDLIRASIEKSKYNVIADSGGSTYYSIWSTSLPIDLQRDTTNRSIVTQNYACLRYFE